MKKHLLKLVLLMCLNYAFAAPTAPLNYEASTHSNREINQMYKSLFKDELKGEDCFKRAYIWSYQMVEKFNARPIKVFFHYTDKFNLELDSQGQTSGLGRLFSGGSKIVWDFHVAPAVKNQAGEIIVLDPKVFPDDGPMTLKEWIDGLAARGEYYLEKRKDSLYDDLEKVDKKLSRNLKKLRRQIENDRDTSYTRERVAEYKAERKEITDKMAYLGIINKNKTKKITCDQITHIEEFDKNQYGAWCFYQLSSMYYFATGELRVLNYGTLGQHANGRLSTQGEINALINSTYRYPVNKENLETKKYFSNGNTIYNQKFYNDGTNYQAREFTDYYLEFSLTEVKSAHRPELDFFKSYLKLKDSDFERQLEQNRRDEERRHRELDRERRRAERQERRERRRRERNND